LTRWRSTFSTGAISTRPKFDPPSPEADGCQTPRPSTRSRERSVLMFGKIPPPTVKLLNWTFQKPLTPFEHFATWQRLCSSGQNPGHDGGGTAAGIEGEGGDVDGGGAGGARRVHRQRGPCGAHAVQRARCRVRLCGGFAVCAWLRSRIHGWSGCNEGK